MTLLVSLKGDTNPTLVSTLLMYTFYELSIYVGDWSYFQDPSTSIQATLTH